MHLSPETPRDSHPQHYTTSTDIHCHSFSSSACVTRSHVFLSGLPRHTTVNQGSALSQVKGKPLCKPVPRPRLPNQTEAVTHQMEGTRTLQCEPQHRTVQPRITEFYSSRVYIVGDRVNIQKPLSSKRCVSTCASFPCSKEMDFPCAFELCSEV